MTQVVENIGHRLQSFINYLEMSNNKFADTIGISGSIVSHMVNGNNFGINKLVKIHNVYSELDLEWLIHGKGNMLKTTKEDKENGQKELDNNYLLTLEIKHLQEQLKSKENELNAQVSLNRALQEIINMLKVEKE